MLKFFSKVSQKLKKPKGRLKARLSELISKRDDVLSKPFEHDTFFKGLEELNYLLGRISFPNEIVFKIMIAIEELRLSDTKSFKEKMIQLKARLKVFEKYEMEKLKIG